ncbi:cytochrome c oxidase subunit 6B [Aspergillus awamori]|uniref:Cytochrome c oxidase subunit 6B n=1 Tax=Aspergillus awamori TaxID=105351 RepID=A0A401KHZ5_ASPAW|nr:cytochrome c oxidase subunit 6B [Aspergillus awamori]
MGAIPEVDPDEPVETKPFKFVTGYDARFPQQNQYVIFAHLSAQSPQTKHCWQNYVDYHKCVTAKGEDFRPCRQFYHAFRSLCPKAWTDRWDGQREAGNFPARLDR